MSMTKTGACPRCGAPIYTPTIWHGVLPPPANHSCGCFPASVTTTTTTNTGGAR